MVSVTDDDSLLSRLQGQLWPGFLLVALGAGALWWQRGSEGESGLGTAVLMAVPVLLAVGVLLLLRAVKLKEQRNEAAATSGRTQRPRARTQGTKKKSRG